MTATEPHINSEITPYDAKQPLCDCERSHNGLGLVGRICDCDPHDPDILREMRDERRRLDREFPMGEEP